MVDALALGFLGLDPSLLNPENLLERFGQWAFWISVAIIFAECGILLGFFLPGDSLLFALGLFIGNGTVDVSIWLAVPVLVIAAIAGNLVGYEVGRRAGPALFRRPDSRLLKRSYLEATHAFFERHGPMAIILARFLPIARTFITVTAGAAGMDYRRYALYSTIGALLWAGGATLLGYFFGNIPIIRNNIEIALLLIVVVTALPPLLSHGRTRLHNRRRARSGG